MLIKINSQRGLISIDELKAGSGARLASIYDMELVSNGQFLTFPPLKNIPTYSIEGLPYLGATASKTFSGTPAEVLKANDLVYSIKLGKATSVFGVEAVGSFSKSGYYYFSRGLIEAGSLTKTGQKIMGYTAFFDGSFFRYSEVQFE